MLFISDTHHQSSSINLETVELTDRRAPLVETSRPAHPYEPGRICREDITVVYKATRVECDLQKFQMNLDALTEFYRDSGVNVERIMESHLRQVAGRTQIEGQIGKERMLSLEELTPESIQQGALLVALGGDNHFQAVAARAEGRFVLGINSDPFTSEGLLLSEKVDTFPRLLENLEVGNFQIQEWSQLKVVLDDKVLGEATCDVFLGERDRRFMSRHFLRMNEHAEEQKGSGLLVATGAGSGGWFHSAGRYLGPGDRRFPRTSPIARFVLTEPFQGKLQERNTVYGTLSPTSEFEVISLNDAEGLCVLDSYRAFPFPRGAKVTISLSERPLKVIIPSP
jgi:NAD kinase